MKTQKSQEEDEEEDEDKDEDKDEDEDEYEACERPLLRSGAFPRRGCACTQEGDTRG